MTASVRLRVHDGTVIPLRRDRWLAPATPAEERLLDRVLPSALDVGCGPGRLIVALAQRGVAALGVDAAPGAVQIAAERGVPVLRRSIFERIPAAGRWGTALLLDGNVGIGGNPQRLLVRLAELLRPGGRVLVEAEPPGAPTDGAWMRIEVGPAAGPWFPWARVGVDRLAHLARRAGLVAEEVWSAEHRWFGVLERP